MMRLVVLILSICVMGARAGAVEISDDGEFTFDINESDDMRTVGTMSGITIKEDVPRRVGTSECRRWANRFGVRPYRAVVSGTLPNMRTRVWICAGNANSKLLAETYCRQIKMKYVDHKGSVVTCRFLDES